MLKTTKYHQTNYSKHGIKIKHDGKKRSIFELLSFSNITFNKLKNIWPEISQIDNEAKEQIDIEAQYSGYLRKTKKRH